MVYTYNLGSGTATITSEPLDLTHAIHVVSLGRSLQEGWMKVIITSKGPCITWYFIITGVPTVAYSGHCLTILGRYNGKEREEFMPNL